MASNCVTLSLPLHVCKSAENVRPFQTPHQTACGALCSVYQKLEDRLRKNSKNLPLAEKREPSGTDAVQPEAP